MATEEMALICRNEEHAGQFASRTRAMAEARRESTRTGQKHSIILTTTYRNLVPRTCWAIYLSNRSSYG